MYIDTNLAVLGQDSANDGGAGSAERHETDRPMPAMRFKPQYFSQFFKQWLGINFVPTEKFWPTYSHRKVHNFELGTNYFGKDQILPRELFGPK
jgi:hypothetical protein